MPIVIRHRTLQRPDVIPKKDHRSSPIRPDRIGDPTRRGEPSAEGPRLSCEIFRHDSAEGSNPHVSLRGKPLLCNDRATIAKEFPLKDPAENLGAQLLRDAALPPPEGEHWARGCTDHMVSGRSEE